LEEDLSKLEVWAGIECTVNRVQDQYFDQLEWNGHSRRVEDLELFAELGIRTIRYPVLWERVAPDGLSRAQWDWVDRRMERLTKLEIRPIVGLVHHGSGPRSTSLVDPEFPSKLAEYAHAVARRYPWVDAYTPINEPLTTARFSGLYGHWYPHGREEMTTARALLNQARATQLAMQAVRAVNADAQLFQTEDLGKTFSTPALDYQADYENTRRWLALDMLFGRVTRQHSLYGYFEWAGVPEKEVIPVVENPCPPDILGLNYYITGERFLDERVHLYPASTHGGNGIDTYADVEAVRVCEEGIAGVGVLLSEAWERYRVPLAISEVHIGCTREEQLRWLCEVWNDVQRASRNGVDVRAVVVWSLLGTYNWHCLVTRDEGVYEPGVFDVRAVEPRATALAHAVKCLTIDGSFTHPVLDIPGWWRRPTRFAYPAVPRRDAFAYQEAPGQAHAHPGTRLSRRPAAEAKPRVILVTGADGNLGKAYRRICEQRSVSCRLLGHADLDVTNVDQIDRVLSEERPWAVINAAGYVRVDDAERDQAHCRAINTIGAASVAAACAHSGIKFVTYSTDLVFDGGRQAPYVESDVPAPLNMYGKSKVEAEKAVQHCLPDALIIRTSAFFSPWDEGNFAFRVLQSLRSGESFAAANDQVVSPTFLPDLVNVSLDLLLDSESGIWHLANKGQLSWFEFAWCLGRTAGLDPGKIVSRSSSELGLAAPRPRYSALASERADIMPTLEDAIGRYCG